MNTRHNPNNGPKAKSMNSSGVETHRASLSINWILIMVIKKPKQLTVVSPVAFFSAGTAAATKLENCGESAVTAMPQRHQTSKNGSGGSSKINGEAKQNTPDTANAPTATVPLPNFSAAKPPRHKKVRPPK